MAIKGIVRFHSPQIIENMVVREIGFINRTDLALSSNGDKIFLNTEVEVFEEESFKLGYDISIMRNSEGLTQDDFTLFFPRDSFLEKITKSLEKSILNDIEISKDFYIQNWIIFDVENSQDLGTAFDVRVQSLLPLVATKNISKLTKGQLHDVEIYCDMKNNFEFLEKIEKEKAKRRFSKL